MPSFSSTLESAIHAALALANDRRHEFATLEHLLLALLDEIERREEEVLAPQVAMIEEKGFQSGNGKGAALEMMAAIARRTAENRERTRFLAVLQGEAMEPSHPAHDWFGLRDDETVQLFTSLLGREAANSPALTRYMISILRGMTGLWLRDENEFDLVEECLAATRLLLNDA